MHLADIHDIGTGQYGPYGSTHPRILGFYLVTATCLEFSMVNKLHVFSD